MPMEQLLNKISLQTDWSRSSPAELALIVGALVFLPTLLITSTSFTRIVIVLSFVRRALATPEIPPNIVVLSISLFLTVYIMGPVYDDIHANAITPYMNSEITATQFLDRASSFLRQYLLRHTRKNDLLLFQQMSQAPPITSVDHTPLRILIPAYITSELKTAFIMGFCIYLPFLLIDLVVAAVLSGMGMMMMPPIVVSTPLKMLLFVLVDGWKLVIQVLVSSY